MSPLWDPVAKLPSLFLSLPFMMSFPSCSLYFSYKRFSPQSGAVAYLLPREDFLRGSSYDFSLVEIHRGAALVFLDEGTVVASGDIVGDDTGAVHVGPSQTLALTQVVNSLSPFLPCQILS